jgi:hypothetical protein
MKKLISTLLLFAFSVIVFAQAPPPPPPQNPPPAHSGPPMQQGKKTPEERARLQSDKLEKDLGLNADQKKKVHDLILTREQKMDQLRDRKDTTGVHAERKKIQDEFRDGMKKNLTPEQFKKWEDLKKERKGNRPPPSPQQTASRFANRMEKELALDPSQKLIVHDLALVKAEKMAELRNEAVHDKSWNAKRKQVMTDFNKGMKATLSKEQYQKWKQLQKEWHQSRKKKNASGDSGK